MATLSITADQRAAALSRLARSDVVALRHTSNQGQYEAELNLAFDRYLGLHWPSLLNGGDGSWAMLVNALDAFEAMLGLLRNSRLTISFKSGNWFYSENKYASYTNFFERGYSGASNDMQKRNDAEMAFGRYSAPPPQGATAGVVAAHARIAQYGVREAPDFRGSFRPRYAAVDFAFALHGGAPKYGKSYLVLQEWMKHNATYVHKDSFEVNADLQHRKDEYGGVVKTLNDVTSTFHELGRILLYCEPAMLKVLHEYATGVKTTASQPNVLGGIAYIEAHLHADILFKRDVKAVVISNSDRLAGVIPHPLYTARWPNKKSVWDTKDAKRVEKNAQKFAADNGILYQTTT